MKRVYVSEDIIKKVKALFKTVQSIDLYILDKTGLSRTLIIQ